MSLLDQVTAFVRVVGSRLLGKEPVYNVVGIGDFAGFGTDKSSDADDVGEQAVDQVGYGALGVIGRQLPPTNGQAAEAISLRTDGGLSPYGWRDLRLCNGLNPGSANGTPAAGQLCFAGYGGAMLTHSVTDGTGSVSIGTWYIPYSRDGSGVPTKALTVSLDPVTECITLLHPDGLRIDLTHDAGSGPGIVLTVDGSTFLRMSAGECTLQAAKIMLKGNVYLGPEPETNLPFAGGPAMPPAPQVFLTPAVP